MFFLGFRGRIDFGVLVLEDLLQLLVMLDFELEDR